MFDLIAKIKQLDIKSINNFELRKFIKFLLRSKYELL